MSQPITVTFFTPHCLSCHIIIIILNKHINGLKIVFQAKHFIHDNHYFVTAHNIVPGRSGERITSQNNLLFEKKKKQSYSELTICGLDIRKNR